jgi:hypothetical protein
MKLRFFGCRWEFGLDEVKKYINQFGIHPGALVAAGMENGGADVAREGIGLRGWWQWGVSLGGDWLCVEFLMMCMLELSMGATEVEVVARVTAVWNWSESGGTVMAN